MPTAGPSLGCADVTAESQLCSQGLSLRSLLGRVCARPWCQTHRQTDRISSSCTDTLQTSFLKASSPGAPHSLSSEYFPQPSSMFFSAPVMTWQAGRSDCHQTLPQSIPRNSPLEVFGHSSLTLSQLHPHADKNMNQDLSKHHPSHFGDYF